MPAPSPVMPKFDSVTSSQESEKAVSDLNNKQTQAILMQFKNIESDLKKAAERGQFKLTKRAFFTKRPSWFMATPIEYEVNKETVMENVIASLKEQIPVKGITWQFNCPSIYPDKRMFIFHEISGNFFGQPDLPLPHCLVTATWGPPKL